MGKIKTQSRLALSMKRVSSGLCDRDELKVGTRLPQFLGYYREEDLPIKKGQTVVIPKGGGFRKDYVRLTSPKVVWAGAGGYWAKADLNDILKVNS